MPAPMWTIGACTPGCLTPHSMQSRHAKINPNCRILPQGSKTAWGQQLRTPAWQRRSSMHVATQDDLVAAVSTFQDLQRKSSSAMGSTPAGQVGIAEGSVRLSESGSVPGGDESSGGVFQEGPGAVASAEVRNQSRGRCWLVGSGPGALEHLTVGSAAASCLNFTQSHCP